MVRKPETKSTKKRVVDPYTKYLEGEKRARRYGLLGARLIGIGTAGLVAIVFMAIVLASLNLLIPAIPFAAILVVGLYLYGRAMRFYSP
jgi:hypothetical protein